MTHSVTVDAREGGEIVTHPGEALACREQVCRRHPTLNAMRPSAAPDQQPPVKGPGGGTPPRPDETGLWKLVHECGVKPRHGAGIMGMNHKRLWYLCEKWSRQGKYDYGVSCDLGWSVERHQPKFRGEHIKVSALDEAPAVHVYPKPPPPPFSGASMAMRVVMAGPETNPALREANRRAVRAVGRRAKQDATRVMLRNATPVVAIDPTPSALASQQQAMVTAMVTHGQVFITAPTQRQARRVMTHFTLHEDGRITDNRAAMRFDMTRGNRS